MEISELLKVPSNERNSLILEYLVSATKGFTFFKEIKSNPSIHEQCCKVMKLEEFSPGEFVFHKGSEGDAIYIILEGEVRVLNPKKEEVKKEVTELKFMDFLSEKIMEKSESSETEEYTEIARIGAGSHFGDMALINNMPRSASIESIGYLKLATIEKEHFDLVQKFSEREITEKATFLKSVSGFEKWSKISLEKLSLSFITLFYVKGAKIYQEGEEANFVYIIKKGEVKMSCSFSILLSQSPPPYCSKGELLKYNKKQVKELGIIIKGPKEIFGQEEFLEQEDFRKETCTCISLSAEIWRISATEFFKNLQSPETKLLISNNAVLMKKWTDNEVKRLENTANYRASWAYTEKHKAKIRPKSELRYADCIFPQLHSKQKAIRIDENTSKRPLPSIVGGIIYNRVSTNENQHRKSKSSEVGGSFFETQFSLGSHEKTSPNERKKRKTGLKRRLLTITKKDIQKQEYYLEKNEKN